MATDTMKGKKEAPNKQVEFIKKRIGDKINNLRKVAIINFNYSRNEVGRLYV